MWLVGRKRLAHQAVSRRNWETVWPSLEQSIGEADFVSFDYELTGLHEKPDERFVGIAQSYDAHCQGARKFVPIQLGVCAAKYTNGQWVLTPASIYMLPSMSSFSVSMSALSFLSSNGFDFNEWISQGLTWMSPAEEQERRAMIQARIDELQALSSKAATFTANTRNSSEVTSPVSIVDPNDKQVIDSLRLKIRNWGSEDILEIAIESAFTRLLAHTVINQEFPDLFSHSVRRGDQRLLCIYRDKEGLFKDQLGSLEQELEKVSSEKTIRGIFDLISAKKLPIVGHNCFYDLLHTYQSFYGEVPPYIDQFKQKWISKFPRTFDTKYLAEANDVLGGLQPPATLKGLCDFMSKTSPQVSIAINGACKYGEGPDLSHDAGYDAMMTSQVFIMQLQHIIERKSLSFDQIDFSATGSDKEKIPIHELLRTGCNRVRLVKTQPPSINLKERE